MSSLFILFFILDTNFLSDTQFENFLPVYDFFHFSNGIFWSMKLLIWWNLIYQFFLLWIIFLVLHLKNSDLIQAHRYFFLFSRSSIILALKCMSMVHFDSFSFCRVQSSSFYMGIFNCPSTICSKDYSVPIELFWNLCQKSIDHKYVFISNLNSV